MLVSRVIRQRRSVRNVFQNRCFSYIYLLKNCRHCDLFFWYPIVLGFNEWHFCDHCGLHFIANLQLHRCIHLGMFREDIAHGNRLFQRRGKGTRCHAAHFLATLRIVDDGPFSGRRFHPSNTHSFLGGFAQFARRPDNVLEPEESAFRTSAGGNGPAQGGGHRIDGAVNVVAVEAEARFQTQGIPRAQSGRIDIGIAEELGRQCDRLFRWYGYFKTIFSSVSTTKGKFSVS
jgi:hypothetical protein